MKCEAILPGLSFLAFLFSFVSHEIAHGLAAYRCGDLTAYNAGRITANPVKHLDFWGSFLAPLSMAALSLPFVIAWGKPVPVNFSKMTIRQKLFTASAGVIANILLIGVGFISVLIGRRILGPESSYLAEAAAMFFFLLIPVNLMFVLFNLLPIPPLDGSVILRLFLGKFSPSWIKKPWIAYPAVALGFAAAIPVLKAVISKSMRIITLLLS